MSGSFRAFDRRPSEAGLRGDAASAAAAAAGASAAHREGGDVDRSSSSETSHSGGDHNNGDVASSRWSINNGMVQEPLWEWEQLNWL